MRPLRAGVVRWLARAGRIARVVVVVVHAVGMVGLRPSPTRPVTRVQGVTATRPVAGRGSLHGWVARGFAARGLGSMAGCGRWRGDDVVLDASSGAGGRVGGFDLVNVVPLFVVLLVVFFFFFLVFFRLGVFLAAG